MKNEQNELNKDGSNLLEEIEELILFEEKVNQNAIEQLRNYTFLALAGLLIISLMVGWYVAGIVLKPVLRDSPGPGDELEKKSDRKVLIFFGRKNIFSKKFEKNRKIPDFFS